MQRFFAFAFAFVLAAIPLGAQQPSPSHSVQLKAYPTIPQASHDRASSSLIMEEMPLVAPLFLNDGSASSELVLANNSSETAGGTISVRALQGNEVAHLHFTMKPHEDRHIALSSLPSMPRYGSLSVLPDSDLKGPSIAGQLLITDRSSSTPAYVDEELAMPDMQGSVSLRSVTDDSSSEPLLAITNLASQTQQVTVHCLESNAAQTSTILRVSSFATALISACSGSNLTEVNHGAPKSTSAPLFHGVVGIDVIGDGGAGQLAAFALAPHARNDGVIFSAVPFTDPQLVQSPDTVFAGVPIGSQPTLPNGVYVPRVSLSNFGSKPAHVSVLLAVTARSRLESLDGSSSVRTPQTISSLTIPPRQSREVVFTGSESQSGLLNSIYLSSDVPAGDLQGKVVSRSTGSLYEIELLAKDVMDPHNAGIHPWSTDADAASHLILYNHSKTTQKFDVGIFNGQVLWDKTYRVDPSETLEVSFNQLMHDHVTDDHGQRLDPSLTSGVVNWATPDPGNATGRLMVTSQSMVMARNYSCGNFVIPCNANFNQISNFIGIGQATALYALNVNYCNTYNPGQCYGNQQGGGSANFSSTTSNPGSINFNNSYDQYSSSPTWRGLAAGSSGFTINAQANGCSVQGTGGATVCMNPTGETAQDVGINHAAGYTYGEQYIMTLQSSGGTSFAGDYILEGDGGGDSDTCHANWSTYTDQTTIVHNTTWTVGTPAAGSNVGLNSNQWGADAVSPPDAYVTYYQYNTRSHGGTFPCGVTFHQVVFHECSRSNQTSQYEQNTLSFSVNVGGVTDCRNNLCSTNLNH